MGHNNTKFLPKLTLEDYAFIEQDKKKYNGLRLLRKDDVTFAAYIVLVDGVMLNPNEKGITEEEKIDRLKIIEMRGLTFANHDGRCIRRPFHKFCNLGEEGYYQINDIDWSDVIILEKLDGSLIAPYILNDQVVWATKKGKMPEMEEYLVASGFKEKYERLARSWSEWTCMFEWCSPNNQIILHYAEQSLTLISMRCIATGDYMPYEKMIGIAKKFDIPIVREYKTKIDNVQTFLQEVYTEKGIEGCVVTSRSTGVPLCKVKCEWYSGISRDMNYIQKNPAVKWQKTINDEWDDLMPHLTSPTKEEMIAFRDNVVRGLLAKADAIKAEVVQIVQSLEGLEQNVANRKFHESVKKHGKFVQIYHAMRNKPDDVPYDIVIVFCKKNIGNIKLVEELSRIE